MDFTRAAEQRGLAPQYIADAFMAVLTWWMDKGAKLPPQEVDGIFRRLVMQGLAAEVVRAGARKKAGAASLR